MAQEKIVYLTKEGLAKAQLELKRLKLERRAKLAKEPAPSVLSSEELNTEFISFKEELDYLDARIIQLEYILKHCRLIEPPPKQERNKIALGAELVLEVNGQADKFYLVGTLEANPSLGKISDESPVGKALLGAKTGDQIVIASPTEKIYKIKKVSYPT